MNKSIKKIKQIEIFFNSNEIKKYFENDPDLMDKKIIAIASYNGNQLQRTKKGNIVISAENSTKAILNLQTNEKGYVDIEIPISDLNPVNNLGQFRQFDININLQKSFVELTGTITACSIPLFIQYE